MTSDPSAGIIAFTWLALAMTLAPGSDTVFVIRSSLRDGWRAGVVAAFGIVCGVVVWAGLAGLGVALLLVRFPLAYNVIAIGGGLYLGYLAVRTFVAAVQMWGSASRSEGLDAGATDADAGSDVERRRPASPAARLRTFTTGLTTNLLNPKIGVFYLSVMPGLFIGQSLTVWLGLLLGGIHAAWGIIWLSVVSILAGWARTHLLQPKPRAVLEAVCGALLLAFGVFVLVEVAMDMLV
ncbi:LysE family translocator [Agromyces sp. LHK192]|uniref:LysE family translocator n=1 Tax=Agromyces sp. LHK192 TaxID=2498704 RepID=UPI000FD84E11|nr:LysE family translocator [Agromyces sp. LHK192]